MQNQLENSIKKITEGLNDLVPGLKNYLEQAKNNLQTNEEKAKFAEALERSNVMNDLQKVTEQFKEVLK